MMEYLAITAQSCRLRANAGGQGQGWQGCSGGFLCWKIFQSRCHGLELLLGTRLGGAAAEPCTGAGTKAEAQAPAAAQDV